MSLVNAVANWTGTMFCVYAGDSIVEGYPLYQQSPPTPPATEYIVDETYHDENSNISSVVYAGTGNLVTGQNMGTSGATVSFVYGMVNGLIPTYLPKYVFFQAGINNLSGGDDWADVESYYDSLLSSCNSNGATLILGEVWPAGIATAGAINAYNVSLNSWATTNGVYVMHTHDWMADPGNNDILLAAYTTDTTHPTNAGVSRFSEIIIAVLEFYEGGMAIQSGRNPRFLVNINV